MKIFSSKKIFIISSILIVIILMLSFSVMAATRNTKQSDPIPKGDSYASYYDDSKGKVKEKNIEIDSKKVTLTYIRTENLNELPVSKRYDKYGTYDVFVDNNQTEYLYLLDSNIYCGFKLNNVGVATEQEKAIPETQALEIADSFLKKNRNNYSDYKLISCEYSELAGYYDIQYYLAVDGYKSDDILRLWVDSKGKITSFSEFYYKRYNDINVSFEKYAKADKLLNDKINKESQKHGITVVDEYITIDNSGHIVLTKVVDLEIPNGKFSMKQRELYTQVIA